VLIEAVGRVVVFLVVAPALAAGILAAAELAADALERWQHSHRH
jgi:hypothetical protein